ncbi:hypothetical protein F183_A03360 [Bryobacterales bacterium F-183]|nr:hypothetical protein F183_A03360 [Bryobacterales bacterium F-183]
MRLWLCVLLAFAGLVQAQDAQAKDDRAVAEWVIRQGGRIIATGSTVPVSTVSGLPADPFTIDAVDLYGTIIEPKDLEKLSGLKHVRELYLPGPSWNPGAGSRLDANEELKFLAPLTTVERLHFSLHFLTNVNVQDKGLKHLESLTNLRELRLAQGRVKNFSFAVFPRLEALDLSYSTATDEVLKSLSGLKNLRRLNLRDTLVTDDGLAALSGVTSLEEIDLYGLKISDKGIAHLRGLKNLRKLNLLGGPISDNGAEILAGLPRLRELNLYRAELTNAGVAKLRTLKELAFLDLRYTRATASGVEQLRAALPKCKVDFSGSVNMGGKTNTAVPAVGAPEPAIAKWIQTGLRGRVEMREGHIVTVALARTQVTDAHIAVLAALPQLRELDLNATEVGDLGAAALAKCPSLEALHLGSTTISDRGLPSLAGLTKLRTLNISGTLVKTLAPLPPNLTDLDLSSNHIQTPSITHVLALQKLERLNLAYTDLDEAGVAKLGTEGRAPLRALDLTGTDTGDTSLAALAKLTTLEELLLNHGRFTAKGFAALAPLTNLKRIEAVRTRVDNTTADTLAAFKQLHSLNLDYTSFGDDGLKKIATLPITELRLDSANIGDPAVATLSEMRSLKLLNLYHTLISEDGFKRLSAALPDTRIVWDRDSKLPNRRGS